MSYDKDLAAQRLTGSGFDECILQEREQRHLLLEPGYEQYHMLPPDEYLELRDMYIKMICAPLPDNKALTCEGCVSFGADQDRTPCFGCKRAVREVDCYRRPPEKGEL